MPSQHVKRQTRPQGWEGGGDLGGQFLPPNPGWKIRNHPPPPSNPPSLKFLNTPLQSAIKCLKLCVNQNIFGPSQVVGNFSGKLNFRARGENWVIVGWSPHKAATEQIFNLDHFHQTFTNYSLNSFMIIFTRFSLRRCSRAENEQTTENFSSSLSGGCS